jgi:hypothetical protein
MADPAHYRQLLPREEALLLISSRREIPDNLLAAATDLIPNLNWSRFLRLTIEHGVGPIVYKSMKRYFSSAIPAPCLDQLKQNAVANAQNNLAVLGQLLAIAQQLESTGIRFAVFKGLIINQLVYQDLGSRKCGDIDLLIDKRNFSRTKAWFLSQGFQQTLSDNDEAMCLQSGLWQDEHRINIDLHWGIPPRDLGIRANKLLNNPYGISIGGKTIPTFSPEDLLIVLCVNASKEYWNQHLYPYCDIHEFLQSHSNLNWKLIMQRSGELKCARLFGAALGMTKELYESSLPVEIEKYIQANAEVQLVVKELRQQLFELDVHNSTLISAKRHLYFFDSTEKYFTALIDSRLHRLIYSHIPQHIRHSIIYATDGAQKDLSPLLYFLHRALIPIQVAGVLFRALFKKIIRHK